MASQSTELLQKVKDAFSRYKFRDERCGVHSVDTDGNILFKQLRKKSLEGFTVEDTLSYCRVLMCQPDTGARFILPRLLELKSRESEGIIREKYQRMQFTPAEQFAIDNYLASEWQAALLSGEGLAAILDRLSFILVLSRRVEPFLAEWLGSTAPLHPAIIELALTIWRTGVPEPLVNEDLRHWLLTDVLRVLQLAEGSGRLTDRAKQALALLRSFSGQ